MLSLLALGGLLLALLGSKSSSLSDTGKTSTPTTQALRGLAEAESQYVPRNELSLATATPTIVAAPAGITITPEAGTVLGKITPSQLGALPGTMLGDWVATIKRMLTSGDYPGALQAKAAGIAYNFIGPGLPSGGILVGPGSIYSWDFILG